MQLFSSRVGPEWPILGHDIGSGGCWLPQSLAIMIAWLCEEQHPRENWHFTDGANLDMVSRKRVTHYRIRSAFALMYDWGRQIFLWHAVRNA